MVSEYGHEYFDRLDGGAGAVDSTMWEDIAHIIKEVIGFDRANKRDLSPNMNVIDWGCAMGFLVRHLRRRGFDAWGVDISEYAISAAPADTLEYLRWFDMGNPHKGTQWSEGYFHVGVSFETMEHISHKMDSGNGLRPTEVAVRHMWDNLVPGGYLLMAICTSGQDGWDSDPTHVTIKDRAFWIERFQNQGFVYDPEKVDHMKSFWLFENHDGVFVFRRPE